MKCHFEECTLKRCGSLDEVSIDKVHNVLYISYSYKHGTVKTVSNGHSKIDKTEILMTNASLMKVKSIAECSPWSILQYF